METTPFRLADYETSDGRCPYQEWFRVLRERDPRNAAMVERRLRRLEFGLLGDHREVRNAVLELRIHEGPGFRIYLRRVGKVLLLILAAGMKRTQKRDIQTALVYWKDFKERNGEAS